MTTKEEKAGTAVPGIAGGSVAGAGVAADAAARRLAELVSPEAVDRMLADAGN